MHTLWTIRERCRQKGKVSRIEMVSRKSSAASSMVTQNMQDHVMDVAPVHGST